MDLREFRQHLWLVLILTALAFFFALVTNYYLDYDDAYITYRYAQRIAHGQGFTYNDGEKVLGTSTPLYTLLLSVPAFLGFDTPQISNLIGLVCWIFLVLLFYKYLRDTTQSNLISLAGTFLFTSDAFLTFNIMHGMETSFYLLLILMVFYLFNNKNFGSTFFLSGLIFLARFDGILVFLALFFSYIFLEKKPPGKKELLLFCIPVVPWLLFSLTYFHTIFPLSMLAKHKFNLNYPQNNWYFFHFFWPWADSGNILSRQVIWPFFLAGISIFLLGEKKKYLLPVLFFGFYSLAFLIYQTDMFPWYVVPPVPSFYLIIVGFFNFLKQKKIKTFFLVILFSVLFYFNIESLLKKSFLEIKNGFFTYEKARYRIAEIINKITPEKTTLQTGTIGQFGYFTNAYIDDLMHLVTPFGQRVKNPDLIIPQDWKWAGRNAGLGVPGYSIIGKILIQPAEEQYYYIYKRLPSQKEPDKKNKRNLQLKFIDPDYYILEEKLSPKNNQMVTIDDKIVFKNFLLREIKSNLLCREYEIFSKYQILKEGTKDFNIELVFSSQIFPNLTYRESYSLFSPKGIKLQPSKNYLQKYVIIVPRFFWFKEFLPIFIFDPDVMLCLQNEKGQKTPVYLKHHAGNFWEFGQNN